MSQEDFWWLLMGWRRSRTWLEQWLYTITNDNILLLSQIVTASPRSKWILKWRRRMENTTTSSSSALVRWEKKYYIAILAKCSTQTLLFLYQTTVKSLKRCGQTLGSRWWLKRSKFSPRRYPSPTCSSIEGAGVGWPMEERRMLAAAMQKLGSLSRLRARSLL